MLLTRVLDIMGVGFNAEGMRFRGFIKRCLIIAALLVLLHLGIVSWLHFDGRLTVPQKAEKTIELLRPTEKVVINKRYSVLYYNPSPFLSKNRKYAMKCGFETCEWTNCDMILDKSHANRSDAVIYDGIFIPERLNFTRPRGQIWIFAAQESPLKYDMGKNWWYRNENYTFNWTMTYNKDNTDIFLPYGEIRKYKNSVKKDFKNIASEKNRTVLMIASNCKTKSKRQEYVRKLRKYVSVDILGGCGRKWNCGLHFRHDDNCFQIINKYRFYLAFENALCHQYFSEKFFENYNYNSVMITRAGSKGEANRLFPTDTHISTEEFKSIKDLGLYLKNLSLDDYTKLLEQKSQYYSAGYKVVYQRALCDLCKKMNFQEKYGRTIKSIKDWAFQTKPCINAEGVTDIN